jgi:hypothetical protein
MSTTVREVLSQHIPSVAAYSRLAANATLSTKLWTEDHSPIMNPIVHGPTYDSINQFLGLDQYLPPNPTVLPQYTADASKHNRLERPIYPLNHLSTVYIQQEGDTVRDFLQNIAFLFPLLGMGISSWKDPSQVLQA